jgi:hypothetical protein
VVCGSRVLSSLLVCWLECYRPTVVSFWLPTEVCGTESSVCSNPLV